MEEEISPRIPPKTSLLVRLSRTGSHELDAGETGMMSLWHSLSPLRKADSPGNKKVARDWQGKATNPDTTLLYIPH